MRTMSTSVPPRRGTTSMRGRPKRVAPEVRGPQAWGGKLPSALGGTGDMYNVICRSASRATRLLRLVN